MFKVLLTIIAIVLIYKYWEKVKLISATVVVVISSAALIFFMYIRNGVKSWYMLRKR